MGGRKANSIISCERRWLALLRVAHGIGDGRAVNRKVEWEF